MQQIIWFSKLLSGQLLHQKRRAPQMLKSCHVFRHYSGPCLQNNAVSACRMLFLNKFIVSIAKKRVPLHRNFASQCAKWRAKVTCFQYVANPSVFETFFSFCIRRPATWLPQILCCVWNDSVRNVSAPIVGWENTRISQIAQICYVFHHYLRTCLRNHTLRCVWRDMQFRNVSKIKAKVTG